MGFALARVARRRGARVILVSGPTPRPFPRGDVEFFSVRTAEEMRQAVWGHFERCSVVIKAAAVSDYRPIHVSTNKMKKGDPFQTLELERTRDILEEVGKKKEDRILVGFAAETEGLIAHARKKLAEKNLDFIVANDVTQPSAGFGVDTNRVRILFPSGEIKDLPLVSKEEVSKLILNEVARLVNQRNNLKKT
jgi:phosphopantothenoylcysteine decarboxylase / phosphopantothenate---cysteine ligase